MNISDLVASIEVELEAAQKREARARKTIEVTLAEVQQESRSQMTEEEDTNIKRCFETIELAKAQQESIQRKLADAKKVAAAEADFDQRMQSATKPANLPERSEHRASVSVGREERTYNQGNDPTGKMFLTDIMRQFATNDVRSADRLGRHMREESVERAGTGYELRAAGDVGTGAFSGLVVPQYLVDMVAPHIANLRPFADVCNKHPLPSQGMSVNIARITTPSQVGPVTTELPTTGVPAQSLNDALLTINVNVAAGQQTVSRQAIERGTGIEDIVMQDLFRQYATNLDTQLVNDATTGLTTVSHSNTLGATDLQSLFSAVMGAMSQSESATLGMAHPTHLLMHPRRWYYLQSLLTTQWPAIASQGVPNRSLGVDNENFYNQGIQGVFPGGLGVVMDANIPTTYNSTTQDVMFVVPNVECHLWEEPNAPVYIRAEQPKAASLGILLVVYGYFAWTFQRYTNATQMVSGTGLVAPSGF